MRTGSMHITDSTVIQGDGYAKDAAVGLTKSKRSFRRTCPLTTHYTTPLPEEAASPGRVPACQLLRHEKDLGPEPGVLLSWTRKQIRYRSEGIPSRNVRLDKEWSLKSKRRIAFTALGRVCSQELHKSA